MEPNAPFDDDDELWALVRERLAAGRAFPSRNRALDVYADERFARAARTHGRLQQLAGELGKLWREGRLDHADVETHGDELWVRYPHDPQVNPPVFRQARLSPRDWHLLRHAAGFAPVHQALAERAASAPVDDGGLDDDVDDARHS